MGNPFSVPASTTVTVPIFPFLHAPALHPNSQAIEISCSASAVYLRFEQICSVRVLPVHESTIGVTATLARVAVAVVLPVAVGAGNEIVGTGESFLQIISGIAVTTHPDTVTAPLRTQFDPVFAVIVGVGAAVYPDPPDVIVALYLEYLSVTVPATY